MEYMTKAEALEALQNGSKITHKYFTSNEYLVMKNDGIYTEDHYRFDDSFHNDPLFLNGWSIYREIQPEIIQPDIIETLKKK